MQFNSFAYAAFLPCVVLVNIGVRRLGLRNHVVLLVASYLFYGAWDARFLALIAASTVIDFVAASRISGAASVGTARRWLAASVVFNLGVLSTFKYFGFFVDSFEQLAAGVGIDVAGPTVDVLLPVGVSFYTFQTMSYTIDVFRGRIGPCRDLTVFATYVAFFPQLVAGPIERAHRLLPQIESGGRRANRVDLERGLTLILVGLFKKVVLADGVARYVNRVFDDPDQFGTLTLAAGAVGFAVQIYGDFSGYTSIARGSACLLGIDLVRNFRQPYLSPSITDFWRRWHISLSDWLRDYLYVPLGGNRRGRTRTYVNLMATMVLGGLWHGASATFVVWGAIHGAGLAAHRAFSSRSPELAATGHVRRLAGIVGTFGFVCLAWVFFRASSVADATSYLAAAVRPGGGEEILLVLQVSLFLVVMVVLDLVDARISRPADGGLYLPPPLAVGAMMTAIFVFSGGPPIDFIYFQF